MWHHLRAEEKMQQYEADTLKKITYVYKELMAEVLSYLSYLKCQNNWYLWKSLKVFTKFMYISVLFMTQIFKCTDTWIEEGCLSNSSETQTFNYF